MIRIAALAILLTCAGCNQGQEDESNASVTSSRAAALEKAANETTNALIKTLDAEGTENAAAPAAVKDSPLKKK